MLKITSSAQNGSIRLTLEGRLAGPWVVEARRSWSSVAQSGRPHLIVDLTGITYVDKNGRALLHRMWRKGAEMIATGCSTKALIEDITSRSGPCHN